MIKHYKDPGSLLTNQDSMERKADLIFRGSAVFRSEMCTPESETPKRNTRMREDKGRNPRPQVYINEELFLTKNNDDLNGIK